MSHRVFTACIAVICALVVLGAAGCLFSTRTAQPPLDPNAARFHSPINPDSVLANIRETFEKKATGNYDQTLAGEFNFVPDPGDVAEGLDFSNWNRSTEIDRVTQILQNPGRFMSLVWNGGRPGGPAQSVPGGGSDESYYKEMTYILTYRKPDNTTAVVFSGKADLYFREVEGKYVLYQWADYRDASANKTFGYLRARPTIQ